MSLSIETSSEQGLINLFNHLCLATPTTVQYYSDSLILSATEALTLAQFTRPNISTLLYRSSRDGLTRTAFHSKCDGIPNTVTIVLNNLNYVFGGYTSVGFISPTGNYQYDSNAYIFSLRQATIITSGQKFSVRDPSKALYAWTNAGPTFGSYVGSYYCDIAVGLDATLNYADFGASYNLPSGYSWGTTATRNYLAGSYSSWTASQVEVYRIY